MTESLCDVGVVGSTDKALTVRSRPVIPWPLGLDFAENQFLNRNRYDCHEKEKLSRDTHHQNKAIM